MARRHGTKGAPKRSKARPVDRKESSMKRWNKLSDIPMDEEDQFHASRDQILLDGEDAQSDDEGEEEEVFALKGIPDDSEDDGSENEEGESDSDEEDETQEKATAAKAKNSKQSKAKQKADSPPLSGDDSASEEEEEGWGTKKSAYYSSNAAELDSEDEEANELEEQEAKRLQAKMRENMADEDFGLGDIAGADSDEQFGEFDEPAPSVQLQSLPQDKQGLLRHLQKTNPEALALAGDWDGTARQLIRVQEQIELIDSDPSVDMLSSGMLHLYYQALLQYAATLAFYLYLRASDKYTQHPESLRSHPIMSRLLTLKQSMSTFESLGVGELDADDESDLDSDEGVGEGLSLSQLRGLAPNELERLLAEVEALKSANPEWAAKTATESEAAPKKSKAKKNKADAATLGEDEPPKKKRKTEKKKDKTAASAVKLPVFDLEEPEFPAASKSKSKSKSSTSLTNGDSSAADNFGEFTTLQDADAQDKAARKRSLRFHTSKIESASARRDRARAALGGDDDIPWKDRQKEKDKRAKQALAKTRGQGGEDLDDAEPEPRVEGAGKKRRRGEEEGGGSDGEGDDAAGYYNLVQQKSKEKKEKKKAEYEAAQAALREGMYQDDTAGDGPRSVSRAILANKGLTPHRSKSVRNPRVKKRQRYEKAKKKVSSQKAVFKGGLAATGKYEGEKSGITKVIKGVRLS